MQYETHRRSILKAISWRTWATITTAIIVFIFTGEFALALTVGLLEVVAKMGLYFMHERLWQRIRYGKREIPSFVLWFTGLPASGKKELAEKVFNQLKEKELKVERIDGRDVRPLFPETGFSPEEVNRHIRRAGHLCAMLEKNGVIVVASFVSPFRESREFARGLAKQFVEVHVDTSLSECEKRDDKGHYAKARVGEYHDFPGIHLDYEPSPFPEITVTLDRQSSDDAVSEIVTYLRKQIFKGKI
ncbi:MAG: adenylyl-sulfate kinase [Desulfuromonas sp.]|nr:MAG: adenylyl-sulfate kinase [Desulfuromonas sp.]